jgi:hypothetical protein
MSKENIYLIVLAAFLCSLNVFFGPLAARIAGFFARLSPSDAEPGPQDAHDEHVARDAIEATPRHSGIVESGQRRRAEKDFLPGPDRAEPAMKRAQISK